MLPRRAGEAGSPVAGPVRLAHRRSAAACRQVFHRDPPDRREVIDGAPAAMVSHLLSPPQSIYYRSVRPSTTASTRAVAPTGGRDVEATQPSPDDQQLRFWRAASLFHVAARASACGHFRP